MNSKTFNEIVIHRCDLIATILANKAKEYAVDTDRLHNFKVAARIMHCTPERALLGMMMKHQVSVMDMIEQLDKGIEPTQYLINEKIGDNINYLVLLEALLNERINPQLED